MFSSSHPFPHHHPRPHLITRLLLVFTSRAGVCAPSGNAVFFPLSVSRSLACAASSFPLTSISCNASCECIISNKISWLLRFPLWKCGCQMGIVSCIDFMAMQILWKKAVLLSYSMAAVLPASWQHCLCSPSLLKSTQINCCFVDKKKKKTWQGVLLTPWTLAATFLPVIGAFALTWPLRLLPQKTKHPCQLSSLQVRWRFERRDDQSRLRFLKNRMMLQGMDQSVTLLFVDPLMLLCPVLSPHLLFVGLLTGVCKKPYTWRAKANLD